MMIPSQRNLTSTQPAEHKSRPLPLAKRLARLLKAHGMTAADFGRLLEREPSMGSKIIHGTRQLTAAHIRRLSAHFALPAECFLRGAVPIRWHRGESNA